jgi:hypothetical protein
MNTAATMMRRSWTTGLEETVENVLVGLAVLACPVAMGLMMWFMMRGMRGGSERRADLASARDLDALRIEHRRLGADIAELERSEGSNGSAPSRGSRAARERDRPAG